MPNAIEGLKPELVWKYFAEISRIPRGSKHEKQISDYVVKTAKKLGLAAEQDKSLNVIVRKPASKGREGAPMVCLQGHLDMVCEKNSDKTHNFEKDPIELVRKGNVLMANGTTLGADNGIAVATNLAIMEDKSLEHGPLEFLFTVDEEMGLNGANSLQPGFVQSRTLLNLDSEEEGALYVGCAGGRNTEASWTAATDEVPAGYVPVLVKVRGLRGGHSGLEIDKGRGNSLKILTRVLLALEKVTARLSRAEGGNKSNAIPREAEAQLYIPAKKLGDAGAIVTQFQAVVKAELQTVEPDLSVVLEEVKSKKNAKVLKRALQKKILRALIALPHGVSKMSADIAGLVETSTNLAILQCEPRKVKVITSQRSSVASELDEIQQAVGSIFELAGADVEYSEGYPGWKPNMDSAILRIARTTYQQMAGREPEVKAIHAGLECGIIGERYHGMDMVSFGPTLEAVHSPDEKIYIDTVPRFYKFLLAILKNAR
jgi:dipeptidase D